MKNHVITMQILLRATDKVSAAVVGIHKRTSAKKLAVGSTQQKHNANLIIPVAVYGTSPDYIVISKDVGVIQAVQLVMHKLLVNGRIVGGVIA